MLAFMRVLRVGIKAENCLTRYRALKAHSTLSSSSAEEFSQLKKSTGARSCPVDTVALEHEADKFRGDIGCKNVEGFKYFDSEDQKLIDALRKADRDVSELMLAKYKEARKGMAFIVMGSIAYCAAICFVVVDKPGSSKEVDGLSSQQVKMLMHCQYSRRMEMKLDGRDIDETREVSTAEQVDYLINQATSVDNLCNM